MSLKRLLAWGGAVAAAVCGVTILWDFALMVRDFFPFFRAVLFPDQGTGAEGIGATSVAAGGQVSIAILALIPSVVVNRWIARRSSVPDRPIRSLHRVHSVLLLVVAAGCLLLALAIPLGDFLSMPGMFAVGLLTLVAIGLQFLVLAGILLLSARSI